VNARDRNALLWWHRDVNCFDCRGLLELLVRDYSTREGVTRPGWRRLMARSGHGRRWVVTHLGHLEDDRHIVVKTRGHYGGGGPERATEWLVPWLSRAHLTTGGPGGGSNADSGVPARVLARVPVPRTRAPLSLLRSDRYADAAAAPAQGGSVVRGMDAAGGVNGDESAQRCGTCDGTGLVEIDQRQWGPCPTCSSNRRENR
jgi:hypothetical protein